MVARVPAVPAPKTTRLECSACGAGVNAACHCGVEYVPAGRRAALAIAKDPTRSDRAIAEELAIDHKTVGKARRARGDKSPPGKRVGRDGKRYPALLRLVPIPASKPTILEIECRKDTDPPVTGAVYVFEPAELAQSELDTWLLRHRNCLPDDVLEHVETARRLLSDYIANNAPAETLQ